MESNDETALKDSNAGAGMTDQPARVPEQEAVKKEAAPPGAASNAAGKHGRDEGADEASGNIGPG